MWSRGEKGLAKSHGGGLISKVVTTLHSSQYSHSAVWLCTFSLVSGLAFGQQKEALLTVPQF